MDNMVDSIFERFLTFLGGGGIWSKLLFVFLSNIRVCHKLQLIFNQQKGYGVPKCAKNFHVLIIDLRVNMVICWDLTAVLEMQSNL